MEVCHPNNFLVDDFSLQLAVHTSGLLEASL